MQILEYNPRTFKTLVSLMAAVIFLMSVSACGYRGPLYLPDEPTTENTTTAESAEPDQDTEEDEEEQPVHLP